MNDYCIIGDSGNPPDKWRWGCVPYEFSMSRCQLSNNDWCRFLNAVGVERACLLRLYHKDMSDGVLGGIELTETNGVRKFVAKSGWGRKPIVYIRYVDVCQYCNWLQTGDIEVGAYDLRGKVPRRNKGARYFLPTEDEWYKAAYYRDGRYVDYPTGSEIPNSEKANFQQGDEFSKGPPYYLADVDDYAQFPSPYGVVQMGGNAWEILEDISVYNGELQCRYRGGSFGYTETGLWRGNCDTAPYNGRCYVFGARIAYMEHGWRRVRYPVKFSIIRTVIKWRRYVKELLRRFRSH